ncbi:MAG: membrane dipeptidase, partial [Acetobacteraceae bacterium]
MNENESRRRFLELTGAAIVATALPAVTTKAAGAAAAAASSASAASVDPKAAALYRNAFVLDCNTLASFGIEFDDPARFEALRESGLGALKTTLGGANGTFEEAVADIAAAQALVERHPDRFIKVTKHGDLLHAKPENKVAVIFSFEAASMLGDKLERIDLFRQLDVLVMQLSYNHTTPFGVGCLDGETGGLTELGRKAIARMNELGVALDLSHSNTRTTA